MIGTVIFSTWIMDFILCSNKLLFLATKWIGGRSNSSSHCFSSSSSVSYKNFFSSSNCYCNFNSLFYLSFWKSISAYFRWFSFSICTRPYVSLSAASSSLNFYRNISASCFQRRFSRLIWASASANFSYLRRSASWIACLISKALSSLASLSAIFYFFLKSLINMSSSILSLLFSSFISAAISASRS